MAEFTPTRSLAIALAEERRTMREGYAFLDEKCLLLAGEMLREVRQWQQRSQAFRTAWREVQQALRAAIARHGLHGLQLYPARPLAVELTCERRTLLGVAMQSAALERGGANLASNAASTPIEPAANPSPERRVRALQDVLLPEVERTLADIEASLEELEQDEAAVLRRIATGANATRAG